MLRVRGDHAGRFLQAQLTADLSECREGQAAPFAWCNPAGRVLVSGWLIRRNPDFFLLLAAGRAPEVVTALGRYVLRDKVELEPAGLAIVPREPSANSLVLPGTPPRHFALEAPEDATDPEQAGHWQRAGIRAGVCELPESLAGRWLPQMLNLDLVGGVSFSKGCYPGQEVVARTFHLGKVKRRLFGYRSDSAAPVAGTVLWAGKHKCGEVVTSVPVESGAELLAVVELAFAGQELRLGTDSAGALTPLPLPYEVPLA